MRAFDLSGEVVGQSIGREDEDRVQGDENVLRSGRDV